MDTLNVVGHDSLIRDLHTKAIVNKNMTDYNIYMDTKRFRCDEIFKQHNELNMLRSEFQEMKRLLEKLTNGRIDE